MIRVNRRMTQRSASERAEGTRRAGAAPTLAPTLATALAMALVLVAASDPATASAREDPEADAKVPAPVDAPPSGTPAASPAKPEAPPRIRDNLFVLEEAYNQEPGVIQHILVATVATRGRDWSFAFTQEWPVPDDRNQLSVTLPVLGFGGTGRAGLGDVLLNYRLQLLGMGGQGPVAIAPRLSLVLPTGSPRKGTGRGSTGVQLNLPVSIEAGPWLVVHLNGGVTLNPSAHGSGGRAAGIVDQNAGIALVVQPLYWMNPLVEVAWNRTAEVGERRTTHRNELVVSPGVRFAIDHRASGLQVVPGIAVPMRVVPSGDFLASVLFYLSFEHPAF